MELSIFSPLAPATTGRQLAGRSAAGTRGEKSFAKFMSRKLADGHGSSNLLGVASRPAAAGGTQPSERTAADKGKGRQREEAKPLAGLLSEFMQQLKAVAENRENGPGSWAFSLPDIGLLQQLGKNTAMAAADIATMNEMLAQDGQLSLPDFFGVLARHFEKLSQPEQVIVPETDLPLLETLLERMGLPIERISLIAERAVVADGSLDLAIFTAGLEQMGDEDNAPITLSSWETGQLRRLMAETGVPRHFLQEMLPEPGLVWEQAPGKAELQERLSLARLQSMLRQTLTAVEAGRPVVDVPAFFADLDRILAQSGFQDGRVGWTPAVQQTVNSMYRELLESVDMATVLIERAPAAELTAQEIQQQILDQIANGVRKGLESNEHHLSIKLFPPELGGVKVEMLAHGEQVSLAVTAENSRVRELLENDPGQLRDNLGRHGFTLGECVVSVDQEQDAGAARQRSGQISTNQQKGALPVEGETAGNSLAAEIQQQVFSQIANGVGKGLQSNEHHLIIKLFPREFGEVKVEMLAHDEQVSLAVTTENSRVKELLENNLGQFRDNLARQGFTMGECMVTMDQELDAGAAWERFVQNSTKQQKGILPMEGETAGNSPAAGESHNLASPAEFVAAEGRAGAGATGVDGRGPLSTGPRPAEIQQQVFSQIASGVLKGLQSNEHHLVIKLFPRELGEVRVEMLVRNEQVSLAITAENSRVKEVLENNLGQFRDNLERQGFTMGECMVSVDQEQDAGGTWQRFVQTWKHKRQGTLPGEGSRHSAGEVFVANGRADRGNGFNIII